jgi:hypothetical protein
LKLWGFSIGKNRCGLPVVYRKQMAMHDYELSSHSTALIQSKEHQSVHLEEIRKLVRKQIQISIKWRL